jgi:hypothetical protein
MAERSVARSWRGFRALRGALRKAPALPSADRPVQTCRATPADTAPACLRSSENAAPSREEQSAVASFEDKCPGVHQGSRSAFHDFLESREHLSDRTGGTKTRYTGPIIDREEDRLVETINKAARGRALYDARAATRYITSLLCSVMSAFPFNTRSADTARSQAPGERVVGSAPGRAVSIISAVFNRTGSSWLLARKMRSPDGQAPISHNPVPTTPAAESARS